MLLLFLLNFIFVSSFFSFSPAEPISTNVVETFKHGARSPWLGEAGVEFDIDDGPYDDTDTTICASYYGFNEDTTGVSFETNNSCVTSYLLSEDTLSFSLTALSSECSLTITFFDGERSLTREIFGYSTELGVFYDDSLNHAERKYMSYKHYLNLISDEQLYAYNDYACSSAWHQPGGYNAAYSQIVHSCLGIKGRLTWKNDFQDLEFPLKGAELVLLHYEDFFGISIPWTQTLYTDDSGRYDLTGLIQSGKTYSLSVNAANRYCEVKQSLFGDRYRRWFDIERSFGQNETLFCFEQDDDISRAMQITQAIYYGGEYASEMSGEEPELIKVCYPSILVDFFGSETSGATNQILFPRILLGSLAYRSWDLILHEYGHWMQHCYGFFSEIPARHSFWEYTALSEGLYISGQFCNMELPWQEGWANAFSLMVSRYYSSELALMEYVGDDCYDGANLDSSNGEPVSVSFETISDQLFLRFGDGGELTIAAVLNDMYDSQNYSNIEQFDILDYTDLFMWNLAMDPSVKNFSDFCQRVYLSPYVNQDYFGMLLSHYGMAVDDVTKTDSWSPTISPTFYLDKCDTSGKALDPFASNSYLIQVYDNSLSSGTLILEKTITNTQSFYFSNSEWDSIVHTYGLSYVLRIRSTRTNIDNPPGNYWSRPFTFQKPTNNGSSTGIFYNSTRLQQSAINLFPSSYHERTVSFEVSGYKVFQTLGELDTEIYVYNSFGSLLSEDDDSGYGYNALVGMYCFANTQYRIKVKTYDSWSSGRTRLVVTSSSGFRSDYSGNIECYDDIVNLSGGSWTYGCWALQYESLMITYTPGQSGYHTISLTSVFDNYLYVIDPRSSKSMFDYGVYEYNDNGGSGYNARLRKHLDQGVPYLIVFCQQNPADSFTNLNEGDDLEIKIEIG